MNLLITGAAGEIGRTLRDGLRGQAELLLSDVREMDPAGPGETLRPADLTRLDEVLAAVQGADAVIHLGGIPNEASYPAIRAVNMDGTFHVLEAARQVGVRRVVFASSIHAVGYYPRGEPIGPDVPVRPDSYYGVSKVFGEALGRMYFERYGLEFVAVRICSFQPVPKDARQLSTWLSPRDAVQLFRLAATVPEVGYLTVAGISGNSRRWMTDEGWDRLGYRPQDNAEQYAAELEQVHGDPAALTEQRQGGVFVAPDYTGLADPARYPLD
ncbi:NAD(P)-dependent oxidoreductase [Deinococcus sonorensis]|uniref:NAD(P)-dependent oxidoreductase n=2 Tax=Deinococcus sonorensis TaxID=309891 RepID=A0AAU7U9T7_9DEIO